jgi:hypothetical protein
MAGEIVRFSGRFQGPVQDQTKTFLQDLGNAEASEAVIEPVPKFQVTLDAVNVGGAATSVGTIGLLRVESPNGPTPETVVILALKETPNQVSFLAPGQSHRFQLDANLNPIPTARTLDQDSSPDFINRSKTIEDMQLNALRVLGPLYKSGVNKCNVTLTWGESNQAETSGAFGEAQVLNKVQAVLASPSRFLLWLSLLLGGLLIVSLLVVLLWRWRYRVG